MAVPELTYTISHYKVNMSTAQPELETFDGMPTDKLRFSFVNPYNQLNVTYVPNTSLQYYEVRVTNVGAEYGIGKGSRLYYAGPNIANGSNNQFTLTFTNATTEFQTDGDKLLGFYAKSSDTDGYWDVTYLLISSDDYILAPNDYDGIEVLTDEPIPQA